MTNKKDTLTSPLTPEAVAQMVDTLRDRRASWLGDGSSPDKLCAATADMIATLAAENATLRAELDQLEQDLSDMRDNVESAYHHRYQTKGNKA